MDLIPIYKIYKKSSKIYKRFTKLQMRRLRVAGRLHVLQQIDLRFTRNSWRAHRALVGLKTESLNTAMSSKSPTYFSRFTINPVNLLRKCLVPRPITKCSNFPFVNLLTDSVNLVNSMPLSLWLPRSTSFVQQVCSFTKCVPSSLKLYW